MSKYVFFRCDECGAEKKDDNQPWYKLICNIDQESRAHGEPPYVQLRGWHARVSEGECVKHLCGGRCIHKALDRALSEIDQEEGR